MSLVGDLIGGVTDLIGGHQSRKTARQINDQNNAMQREFAQHGIRWKVEDAEKAGVHPLFALGAQTTGYTPSSVVPDYSDYGRAGEKLGNAVSKALDPDQRELTAATRREIDSRTNANDAQASMYRSQAMLNLREFETPPFPPTGRDADVITDPVSGAIVRKFPAQADFEGEEIFPTDLKPIQHEGWTTYNFGNGPVTLFRGDPDQLMSDLQDMDNATRAAIIAENEKRGQSAALLKLFDFVGDKRKEGREYGRQFGYGYKGKVGPGGILPR